MVGKCLRNGGVNEARRCVELSRLGVIARLGARRLLLLSIGFYRAREMLHEHVHITVYHFRLSSRYWVTEIRFG